MLCACALSCFTTSAFADSVDSGTAFLLSQQHPDGSFAGPDDVATAEQATGETLRVLDAASPARATAIEFLTPEDAASPPTEFLARRLSAGEQAAPVLAALLARQRTSGGFGAFVGQPASALDTAYALQALVVHGVAAESAVSWLAGRQLPGGAWPGPDGSASVFVTAHALSALWAYRHQFALGAPIGAARAFLLDARGFDGLWNEFHESVLALAALAPTMADGTAIAGTMQHVAGQQSADGSWFGDAYLTALAVRALRAAAAGYEDRSAISGRIVDGDTLASLAGVSVEVTGPETKSLSTDADGRFLFEINLPGTYRLDITHAGYPPVSTDVSVGTGIEVGLGTVRLLKSAGTATASAQGTVRDASTGAVLAGATVHAGSVQVTTDSTGGYLISGLAPGSIQLVVSKAGYESAALTTTVSAGSTLLFSPALREGVALTFNLVGSVRDADSGAPITGATLTVEGAATASTTTGDDGGYVLRDLTPGVVTVTAVHPDYHPLQQVFDIPASQTWTFSPSLRPATQHEFDLSVFGTVTDRETTTGLSGVTVVVTHDNGTGSAVTGGGGGYALTLPPSDTLRFEFSLDGYQSQTLEYASAGYSIFGLDVALRSGPPQASIEGHVVDSETAAPIVGASVRIDYDGGFGVLFTDAAGYFQTPPFAPGPTRITISADGYHDSLLEFDIPEGKLDLGVRTLEPVSVEPVHMNGVVLDSTTGLPIVGATVSAQFESGNTVTHSAADGTFGFTAQPHEVVAIEIQAAGYLGTDLAVVADPENPDLGQVRMRPEGLESVLPDLRVHSVSRPAPASDADSFHVSGTVDVALTLAGNAIDAPAVRTVAFHDADGDGAFDAALDTLLGEVTVPGEEFGAEPVMRAIPVTGVLPFRDAPISVTVDAAGVVVEKDETNNVRSTALLCRRVPDPLAQLTVRTKWHWKGTPEWPNSYSVWGPVVVGQLTDDNDDGVIDVNDIPDLVFISATGLLNVISGDDGSTHWQVRAAFPSNGSVSLADITGDGVVEIIVPRDDRRRLWAYRHDGTLLWDVPTGMTQTSATTRDSPAIADLDGDGIPEIVHGNRVFRADGSLMWAGTALGAGGYSHYGYLPTVADIDLDGSPEVIAGRAVYRSNGQLYWQAGGDGFTAIGNFDDDDFAEIVIVSAGRLSVREHTGALKWGPVPLPSRPFSNPGDGGAPTIGDFDGDGVADIGVAAASRYAVYRADGSLMWSRAIDDPSAKTGSSVFDFNGDGRLEVVYADEDYLYIFDGATGNPVIQIPNGSSTTLEYPIIADIDNSGSASIVLGGTGGTPNRGVRALESDGPGWMPTRSIWNQHTYHVTNINDDGTIPAHEEPSWLAHNTYRANAFLDRDPLDSADLTIGRLRVVDHGLGQPLSLRARVGNAGIVPSGTSVISFFDGDDAAAPLVGTVTLAPLRPGEWRDMELAGVVGLAGGNVTAIINAGGGAFDCDTTNDSVQQAALPTRGAVTVATDAPQYAPEQVVTVGATVENTGTFARDYTVEIRIEDADGDLVEALGTFAAAALQPGATQEVTAGWNTGLILAGEYRIRTTLYGADGIVLGESVTTFVVAHDAASGPSATLRVTTDRPRYHTTDSVAVDLLAQNQSASTLLGASSVDVTVTGPTGPVFDETLAVHELTPGSNAALVALQELAAAAVGEYEVAVTWRNGGGAVLAVGAASYQVHEDLAQSLAGTVTLSVPEVHRGDPLLCTQRVANAGTLAVSVPLRQVTAAVDESDLRIGPSRDADITPGAVDTFVATVTTGDLGETHHACIVQAEIEGEWLSLGHAVFNVLPVPISIDAALSAGARGRLLMLLDPACAELEPPLAGGGPCDDDPYGPTVAPGLPVQRAHLEAVLEDAGWHVTIVTSVDAFEAEFASGAYEVYALFNEQLKLSEALQERVAADINAGRGLLVTGDHDRRNGRLETALGVQSLGKNYDADALVLEPIGDHPGGTIPLSVLEKPNAMRLEGAEAIGLYRVAPGGNLETGMTRYRHGQGTGIYGGFDLPVQSAAEGGDGEFAHLFDALLAQIHPAPYQPVAGRVFPLVLTLQNAGIAVSGEVHLSLPADVTLVEGPPGAAGTDEGATWPFTLAVDELSPQAFWIRLPEVAGWVEVEAVVFTPDDDGPVERARVQILLNVQPKE